MPSPVIEFPIEAASNSDRRTIASQEPVALRTFTPSQAVLAHSSGVFHFTPEGRRLYDYSSGVLVANLGHNPPAWMRRFATYMGWSNELLFGSGKSADSSKAVTLTAYNAVTPIE